MPQSPTKTTMGYELYSYSAQLSPFLEMSIQQLKGTTFEEIERLQRLQKQLIEGRLVLDHGTYDLL